MKIIILVSGKFGAGKTISASYIASALGGKKYSFAKKVKDIAYQMGWNGDKDDKGRKLLQEIGRLGRWYNEDIWANLLIEEAKKDNTEVVVVDDWRFENEYGVCSSCAKTIRIRVYRNVLPKYSDMSIYQDASENSLPEEREYYDYTVDNNGTFEELYENLDKIIYDIERKFL